MATGKKSALTGKEWRKGIHKGDYCVIPQQKWLDGYVIEKGVVAQFVAVPLGQELTVEEQLGGDGIGGIQIEVYPMKADCFERRWPKQPPPKLCERGADARGILRSRKKGLTKSAEPIACAASTMDFGLESLCEMGIGAGGRMKQQVFEDPYGKDEWCKGCRLELGFLPIDTGLHQIYFFRCRFVLDSTESEQSDPFIEEDKAFPRKYLRLGVKSSRIFSKQLNTENQGRCFEAM